MLYLLQLVQALKFEPPPSSPSSSTSPSSSLRHSQYPSSSSRHAAALRSSSTPSSNLPNLEDFLIERSARNPILGNHFHWYIQVEKGDEGRGQMFEEVAKKFEARMKEVRLVLLLATPFRR